MSKLIDFARTFAIAAHSAIGQKRKGSNIPYWRHPEHVAEIVMESYHRDAFVAAAWLHDVLEDTQVTKADIASAYLMYVDESPMLASEMTVVMQIVDAMTNRYKDVAGVNRIYRVCAEILRHSRESLEGFWLVKLADVKSNLSSIEMLNPSFIGVYCIETQMLMEVAPSWLKSMPAYVELFEQYIKLDEQWKFRGSARELRYANVYAELKKAFPKSFTKEQLYDHFAN